VGNKLKHNKDAALNFRVKLDLYEWVHAEADRAGLKAAEWLRALIAAKREQA
jgi:hypothetical protein